MCGKNSFIFLTQSLVVGSPPRVREKLWHSPTTSSNSRITPACAGKTKFALDWCWKRWDHPRVCGKNKKVSTGHYKATGSPPRVREKRSLKGLAVDTCGITPACAGKTNCVRIRSVRSRDHPRVCGKNNNF